jgi:hypothetical protein
MTLVSKDRHGIDLCEVFVSEEFVRVGEAARIIGVTKKTMQRWDRSGVLKPARRMPSLGCRGGRLYTRKQLNSFVKERMEKE